MVPDGADGPRDEALLQVDDEEVVHPVGRIERLQKIVVHEVGRVVALEALVSGRFRRVAGNVPFAGLLAGELQVEITAAVHDEAKAPPFQFRAVRLRELVDGVFPARIVFEIQCVPLPSHVLIQPPESPSSFGRGSPWPS